MLLPNGPSSLLVFFFFPFIYCCSVIVDCLFPSCSPHTPGLLESIPASPIVHVPVSSIHTPLLARSLGSFFTKHNQNSLFFKFWKMHSFVINIKHYRKILSAPHIVPFPMVLNCSWKHWPTTSTNLFSKTCIFCLSRISYEINQIVSRMCEFIRHMFWKHFSQKIL